MASGSLQNWLGSRAVQLDEIQAAHRAVGGSAPGRRWATEQLNYAYAVLLSSQFQAFCRDLHSECVDYFVRAASPGPLQAVVRAEFLLSRRLDHGNPNPSNIGADFNRLGVDLWSEVKSIDGRNAHRQARIQQLANWRNAIAHQDFSSKELVPSRIQLSTIRSWRSICGALAVYFDRVMKSYLHSATGSSPW